MYRYQDYRSSESSMERALKDVIKRFKYEHGHQSSYRVKFKGVEYGHSAIRPKSLRYEFTVVWED